MEMLDIDSQKHNSKLPSVNGGLSSERTSLAGSGATCTLGFVQFSSVVITLIEIGVLAGWHTLRHTHRHAHTVTLGHALGGFYCGLWFFAYLYPGDW